MPDVIAEAIVAAATYVATQAAAAVASITVSQVVGFVVTTAIGIGLNLLLAPKTPSTKANDNQVMVRSTTQARRVIYGRQKVAGTIIYAEASGADNGQLNLLIALAGHPVQEIGSVFFDDYEITGDMLTGGLVTGGRYKNAVAIGKYTNGNVSHDVVANGALSDTFTNLAILHVSLNFDKELFSGGIPNITAIVKGKSDIYDPRTGTTGYTTNWALCVRDYLTATFGMACSADEINDATFIAAANLSDEAVPLNADGSLTQPRYTLNGTITLDETPINIVEQMLSAGCGALTYVAGKYCLYGGAYIAPSATLGVSDFAGPVEVQTMPPRAQLMNGVKGTFIDPYNLYQAMPYPAVYDPSAVAADGEELWKDLDFVFCNDYVACQRLAYQVLKRNRNPLTVKAKLRYSGIQLTVWQTVAVTLPDLGWSSKPFRIVAWSFSPSDGTCNVTLQEEQIAAYAWIYEQAASVPDYPDTTLADPFDLAAPAGLSASESLYTTRDGSGVRTKISLTWLAPPSAFVVDYEVQYRPTGGDWRSIPPTYGETTAEILDVASGTYDVRVRAKSPVKSGDWATITVGIGGLIDQPPADITGQSIQSIGGLAYLRWTQSPDIDVRVGGRIEIRHTPDASPFWTGATSIGDAVPGDATFALLPLKPGTYLIKAVDAGGRYSENAASVLSTQATALGWASVSSLTESPTFPGAKSSVAVTGSTLRLGGGALLDTAPSWDAITSVDLYGGIASAGTYSFSGGMDLGSVQGVRLTSHLSAAVVNTQDQIDSRTMPIDEWGAVDGVAGGEADAWVEVRSTQTDPAGSPTWTAWQRLDAAEFRARGFQFRAQLTTSDPAFNISITELSVTAEKVA